MNQQVHDLLREAQRRYTRFHDGEVLTEAWTGLGYRTTYDPALKDGLMKWVIGAPAPRAPGWLRLTEDGAQIVQEWLDEEVNDERQD